MLITHRSCLGNAADAIMVSSKFTCPATVVSYGPMTMAVGERLAPCKYTSRYMSASSAVWYWYPEPQESAPLHALHAYLRPLWQSAMQHRRRCSEAEILERFDRWLPRARLADSDADSVNMRQS